MEENKTDIVSEGVPGINLVNVDLVRAMKSSFGFDGIISAPIWLFLKQSDPEREESEWMIRQVEERDVEREEFTDRTGDVRFVRRKKVPINRQFPLHT